MTGSVLGSLRAGVVGTGFVGVVHVHALRLLGVDVAGVVGSSPERAAAKGIAPVYESLEALLADPSVDVLHLTTPNHLHHPQAKQVLEAGKHVVCEKPLAMTSEQSAELLALADSSGLVHCTNFNLRFFPLVHEARARVAAGEVGDVWNVHGGYLQDWLLYPTDWNWRLEPDKGGALRAIGDIGSHWMDMAQFVSGRRITEVCADLHTTIPVRRRPLGEVETFSSADDVEREDAPMATEDIGHVLVRFDGGARGAFKVSQGARGARTIFTSRSTGRRQRSPGTPSGTRSSGSAPATSRAPCCNGTPRSCSRPRPRTRSSPPATPRAGWTRSASSTAASTGRSRRVARPPSLTTPPSRTGTAPTSWATPSPSPTPSDDGWRFRHEAWAANRRVPSRPARTGRDMGVGERLRDARGRLLAGGGR